MRRRDGNSIWMTILVGLVGFVIGFFIGQFFMHLSQNVDALSFLGFLGYSANFGLQTISLNLIFAQITFGLTFNISVMGVIAMIIFLLIYFRRR